MIPDREDFPPYHASQDKLNRKYLVEFNNSN